MGIRSIRDLRVWRLGMDLVTTVYQIKDTAWQVRCSERRFQYRPPSQRAIHCNTAKST